MKAGSGIKTERRWTRPARTSERSGRWPQSAAPNPDAHQVSRARWRIGPCSGVWLAHESRAAGLVSDVKDEACPVAPPERQARTGGRPNVVPAVVLDPHAQRRANEPTGTSEQDRRADPGWPTRPDRRTGRSPPSHTATPAPATRPLDADVASGTRDAVAPHDPGFEHETVRDALNGHEAGNGGDGQGRS